MALETEEEFRQAALLWRQLHAAGSAPSPLASWEWAWNWWLEFGKPCRGGARESRLLLVAVLTELGELIGLFPFHYPLFSPFAHWTRRSLATPCCLRAFGFLGKHHEAMAEAPIWVALPGAERLACESVLEYLLRRQPRAGWDTVEMWAQHTEPTLLAAPATSCTPWQAQQQHRRVSPVMELALPPTWQQLRASLSKSMRDNLGYYPRLLGRRGHSWEVTFAVSPSEVCREAEALVALHRQREAARPGARPGGHLPSSTHKRFLSEVLSTLAAQGEASIAVLWIDGQQAASQALLHRGKSSVFYYSGFDPAWSAYSPLTILHAEIFTELIRHGVTSVNLLAGVEVWKTRWGARPAETLQHLAYLHRRPASLARLWLYGRRPRLLHDPLEEKIKKEAKEYRDFGTEPLKNLGRYPYNRVSPVKVTAIDKTQ